MSEAKPEFTTTDLLRLMNEKRLKRKMGGAEWCIERITCADGLSMSVQASMYHYCSPRIETSHYDSVEVGFPSKRVDELMPYAETPGNPTRTVYAYVPTALVARIIQEHGGLADEPI